MAGRPKAPPDPLADVGQQLIREDPELRALARQVYQSSMKEILRDLKAGNPQIKLALYKLLLPTIMKEAVASPEGEDATSIAGRLHTELLEGLIKGQGKATVVPRIGPINEGSI